MGLRLKFNIVLAIVFLVGLAISGYISYTMLQNNARDEVLRSTGVMMEAALSMRAYTVNHGCQATGPPGEFLPESVPAFAATEAMNTLRQTYSEYVYKEAALNPTNPRDRAVEWEADIIDEFRNDEPASWWERA